MPYIYSMSPFGMLKTCEQWRTDVDYNHLPVRLVGRLSGLAMGYFGTSHYAVEDIAIARTMNNTVVLSPADAASCVSLMRSTAALESPVYIRIAEGVEKVYDEAPEYEHGKWPRLRDRRRHHARRARQGRRPRGRRRRRPSSSTTASRPTSSTPPTCGRTTRPRCSRARRRPGKVLTIEEHSVVGGLGTIVAETVARAGLTRQARPGRAAGRGP